MNNIFGMETVEELRAELIKCIPMKGYSGYPGSFNLLKLHMEFKDRIDNIIYRSQFLEFEDFIKEAKKVREGLVNNIQSLLMWKGEL